MKREMSEEIKKALLDESAGYVDWDEASEGDKKKAFREANVFKEGAKWMFNLMSEQQKPMPMEAYFDSRPDYEKEILILTDLGCVSAWFCEEDHNWVCLDDSFQLDLHEANSWLPLPTLEGE